MLAHWHVGCWLLNSSLWVCVLEELRNYLSSILCSNGAVQRFTRGVAVSISCLRLGIGLLVIYFTGNPAGRPVPHIHFRKWTRIIFGTVSRFIPGHVILYSFIPGRVTVQLYSQLSLPPFLYYYQKVSIVAVLHSNRIFNHVNKSASYIVISTRILV